MEVRLNTKGENGNTVRGIGGQEGEKKRKGGLEGPHGDSAQALTKNATGESQLRHLAAARGVIGAN